VLKSPRDRRLPRPNSTATAAAFCLAGSILGCGSPAAPDPPVATRVVVEAASPASGGAAVVPSTYPYFELGGVVLPPQSGLISVRAALSTAREVPFGQLNVYLLTGGTNTEYCGQNLPDAPTWRSLPAGWSTTFTVTGFQVFRVPCTVTGLRVMFHTRGGGLAIPPQPAETIAEATFPVNFQISLQAR